jgi:dTDP-4-amino-4,6-dideoxygalactose transaminase
MLARVRSNLTLADLLRVAARDASEPIAALEEAFAVRFAFPHALLFPYARSGLYALMLAQSWRQREILCPAYICAEVPYAVSASGNRAKFVDSAADHFLPEPPQWQAGASRSAAMAIVTPLFGYPVDKEAEAALRAVAPGIFVLYDESQSYGVEDQEGLQMRDADGALFSLGLGKMATALSGGVLLLRDTGLFQRVRTVRDSRFSAPRLAHTIKLVGKGLAAWTAFHEPALTLLDVAARWLPIASLDPERAIPTGPKLPADATIMPSRYQARLGMLHLSQLDLFLAARRAIGQAYQDRLHAAGLRTFRYRHTPTWPRFPLPVAQRNVVVSAFRRHGIQLSPFLPYSSADLPVYREQGQACRNAALWGRSMINLPNWHGMKSNHVERIVAALLDLGAREARALAWPAPGDPS